MNAFIHSFNIIIIIIIKGHSLRRACLQPATNTQNSKPRPPTTNLIKYHGQPTLYLLSTHTYHQFTTGPPGHRSHWLHAPSPGLKTVGGIIIIIIKGHSLRRACLQPATNTQSSKPRPPTTNTKSKGKLQNKIKHCSKLSTG